MKRFYPERVESRREFFRAAARYGCLGLLGAVTAVGTQKSLSGQQCVNRGICAGCAAFSGCGLPQALSAKAAKRNADESRASPQPG
jgi:hypothetical protein